MEPMKPELINRLLHERPNLTRADIDEYHRLQAQRFLVNPLLPRSPDEERATKAREDRIKELHGKIYG
jgi:hypothetical protein